VVDFSLISLNTSLFGSQFNANNGIGASSFSALQSFSASNSSAIETPWAEPDDATLLSRYNKIRNKTLSLMKTPVQYGKPALIKMIKRSSHSIPRLMI
jgi:hypothetical protein